MKKIGVLGGTFDPIHLGHLYIAYEAYEKFDLDKIIFMPGGNPPHKQGKNITEANIRYEMVKEAIKDYSFFAVSKYEIDKKEFSYTFETLEYLNNMYSSAEIYFITGADCLINLEKWKNVKKIMDLSKMVVFNRPGYSKNEIILQKEKVEQKYNNKIIYLDLLNLEISSTLIRERVSKGLYVDFFLPPAVKKLIEEKRLYIEEWAYVELCTNRWLLKKKP